MTATVGVPGGAERAASEHRVLFYDDDAGFGAAVGVFVTGGLQNGDAVLVIATAEHRLALEAYLSAEGLSPAEACRSGRLVMLDAEEMLASFCGEAEPDPVAFEAIVGGAVAAAGAAGRPVRAFGEMVALLWDAGAVVAAIKLEQLWCGLGDRMPFELLCAYPAAMLVEAGGVAAVNEVCSLHSSVHPPADTDPVAGHVRAYPPSPESVTKARHDLTAALGGVEADAIGVASLIVSELAANAVRHAGTEFVVEITNRDGVVRVAVRDRSDAAPVPGRPPADLESGRGLLLVAALTERWGVTFSGLGKVVWAEIRAA